MADDPFLKPGERLRDLRALEAMHEQPDISQRDLAVRLGIAVGLVNACIGKMARKGWIKIKRVNSRKLTYALTTAGFSEKLRLSIEFTETSIGFYRRAKETVAVTLGKLAAIGAKRLVLVGAGDLTEIIGICSGAFDVELVAIVENDPERAKRVILGMTPVPPEELPEEFDALVVAQTDYEETGLDMQKLAGERLVAWPLEGRIESSEEVAE